MKIQKLFLKLFYFALAITIITACSKDRLDSEKEEVDEYGSMDSFYDQNKQEEQEFVIDSGGTGPIIGNMDTKIFVSKDLFMHQDSSAVDWPYIIKLIEIYPVKDIILWELPTVAGGNILESAAQIRVRAFKGSEELLLKPGKNYYVELDTMQNLNSNMKVYYGFNSNNYIDWAVATDAFSSVITDSIFYYSMFISKMGWVDCARLHSSGSNTTITFSAQGNHTENIDIFLVFKDFNSVMQVYNLQSGQVPVGGEITVIAMAMNQDGDYVLHNEDITVTSNHQITLNLQVVSESALLNTLDGL